MKSTKLTGRERIEKKKKGKKNLGKKKGRAGPKEGWCQYKKKKKQKVCIPQTT